MSLNVNFLQSIQPMAQPEQIQRSQDSGQAQFADSLKDAINDLNESQIETEVKTEQLVNGEIDDLHDVMITAQKSSLSLNLATQVQGSVLDAYNEVMRMQV
ncbi:flagellar hook-basal body complex protein FliE [Pelagirhabdus alkalitolerans]|uniref:Flagellar hook-basal body complex protein FliE n=1 Tax=Pelagirhabdus alkalitolerans TaxID=1612202 RepID=A0A1G6H2V2_9BACI|nr:flagellar hook-basal body complex protein FliE [Pelagirhabdus alkalitolerans]SDB88592.1 flagellar hook-basal body complex protein FliE [Pelagirhabdus alkalitolerans]